MEIDQELLRYDSSKGGNQGSVAEKEKEVNAQTESNEVANQSPPDQLIPQEKDEEHASHVDKGKNHNKVFSETESYTTPKWKRLERKQSPKEQEALHRTSLKRSGPETEGHEYCYKRRQVYHEDQDKLFVLAEAISQPCQGQ